MAAGALLAGMLIESIRLFLRLMLHILRHAQRVDAFHAYRYTFLPLILIIFATPLRRYNLPRAQ